MSINSANKPSNDPRSIIITRSQVLKQLLEIVKKNDIELQADKDNFIQNFRDNELAQWRLKHNFMEMKRLFSGQLAIFNAKVEDSKHDAVKFKTVYITFNTTTIRDQEKLNNLLKKCFIELTHSGMSNYKFRGKTYAITPAYKSGEKLMLRYKYDVQMPSTDANESFKKLSQTRPFLSPYTLWSVRIVPQSSENTTQILNELSDFLIENSDQEMIISLRGSGHYVLDTMKSKEECINAESNEINFSND